MPDQTTTLPMPLKTLRKSEVWVVGGSNMDISAQTPTALLRGDSTPGQLTCSPGGVARNVAENLARLGVPTHLIGVVGDDVFGQRLRQGTAVAGVMVEALLTLPSQRTASYLSLLGPDGDMALAVNDMDILAHLTPDLLKRFAPQLSQAVCWVVDCNLAAPALQWLFDNACQTPIFVDAVSVAKCGKLLPWLGHIHALKVNQFEAQALSDLPAATVFEAQAAALRLHQLGACQVVVSLGAQGVCWCDAQGQVGHRAAGQVGVVNTTGAGDALLAGLVHGHVCHLPLPEALEFALACADLTLASPFANAPGLCTEAVYSRVALSRSFHSSPASQ